jgi:hypothetical protein
MDILIFLSHDGVIDVELTVDGAILKFRMFGVDTLSEFKTLVVVISDISMLELSQLA